MSRARREAARLLSNYFATKGRLTPEAQASSLIRRVLIGSDNRWQSDTIRETASGVLRSAAFNVDDLAENFLDVDLTISSLRDFDQRAGAKVFGLAYPDEHRIVICDRAEQYPPLYRSTVAHELGHVLLHRSAEPQRQLCYSPLAERRPHEENEVDEFMIALLLPERVLTLAVGVFAEMNGVALQDCLGHAGSARGRWIWRHLLFRRLIEELCLSRQLIAYRMRSVGYFTSETVRYHLSYRLPNRWRQSTPIQPMSRTMDDVMQQLL